MRFEQTLIAGVWIISPEPDEDARGLFARTFCALEFAAHGLSTQWVQCSVSYNRRAGTLRGMHYQVPPDGEAKLVRCVRGAVFDVALDLRTDSATFKRWVACELTSGSRCALYVPQGCAHGFQTLTDDAEVFYQISAFYRPESARGVRWNDPSFGIAWPPADRRVVSLRDASYADFPP